MRASGCFFKRAYVQEVKLWLDWNREATSEIHKTSEWKQFMGFLLFFLFLVTQKFSLASGTRVRKQSVANRSGMD